MPKIIVLSEFGEQVDSCDVSVGVTFANAAMANWPEGFPGQTLIIMDHEHRVALDEESASRPMQEGWVWTIVQRPQVIVAGGIALAAGSAAAITWVQIAITVATMLVNYMLKPELPSLGAQYQWDDSDKPQYFSAQSNRMTPGSRVPDVFGNMRVWPNLISEPWVRYESDSQTVSELYAVTNGTADVSDARLSDEDIGLLPSSAITVYKPGEAWPTDYPVMKTNAFVGSVELPGPNESVTYAATINIRVASSDIYVNALDYFTPFLDRVGEYFVMSYEGIPVNNKQIHKLVSISADGRTLNMDPAPGTDETLTLSDFSLRMIDTISLQGGVPEKWTGVAWQFNYIDGRYMTTKELSPPSVNNTNLIYNPDDDTEISQSWFQSVTAGDTVWANRFWISHDNPFLSEFYYLKWSNASWNPNLPGTGFTTSVFSIPGTTVMTSWSIEFPSGLYQQTAGGLPETKTVEIEFNIRAADSDDPWVTNVYEFTDLTRTPRRFTKEIVHADIGLPASGQYECYFRRITEWTPDENNGVTADACRLISLSGQQDVSGILDTDVLNVTLVRLDLTTQNAQQITQARSFNVMCKRYLPNWCTGDGSTLRQTRQLRDAIMYTLMADGTYDITEVSEGRDQLNAIHADLAAIGDGAAHFNGILDQTMTVDDQITLMAAIARISPYRRASNMYFSRLKAGLTPRTLLNSRNKVDVEQKTMNFSMRNEPDAIVSRFMDEDDDYKEATIQYPTDITPTNPSEQQIIGVTDPINAARVTQYLWDKRHNERDMLSVRTTLESVLLAPGDVVAVTDHLAPSPPIEGEVVQILNPSTGFVRLDQPIVAGTYIARLRDKWGEFYGSGVATVGGTNADEDITVPAWAGVEMVTEPTSQVGLLYSLTLVNDADSELFYVTGVVGNREEGTVEVSTVNYSDATYAADTADVATATNAALKQRKV